MLPIAVSTIENLKSLPPRLWINLAMAIMVFCVAILLFRKAAQMNRIFLGILVVTVCCVFTIQWIYERNEPRVLSPLIDKVAPLFPGKINYNQMKNR